MQGTNSLGETIFDMNPLSLKEGNNDDQDCAYWWESYGGGWWDRACTSGPAEEFNYVCEKSKTLHILKILLKCKTISFNKPLST